MVIFRNIHVCVYRIYTLFYIAFKLYKLNYCITTHAIYNFINFFLKLEVIIKIIEKILGKLEANYLINYLKKVISLQRNWYICTLLFLRVYIYITYCFLY